MAILRLTNGFDGLTDPALLAKSRFIHAQMEDNLNFTSPSPSLLTLATLTNSFEVATTRAATGNKQDGRDRDAVRAQLIDTLHLLSAYVLFTSAGNATVAASSGFTVGKPAAPRPPMAIPENLVLANGANRGELKLSFTATAGAKAYIYQYTTDPQLAEGSWTSEYNTINKNTFSNLTPGVEYYVRVMAIGINKQTSYSEVVSRMVI